MFHKKILSSSNSMWNDGILFLGSVKSLNCRCKMAAADFELMVRVRMCVCVCVCVGKIQWFVKIVVCKDYKLCDSCVCVCVWCV